MKSPAALVAVVLLIAAGTSGCGEPLHFGTLQLGRSVNGDHTVAIHTTRFKPDDTIYAAVLTDQTGASTITARWSYAGKMVSETQKKVSYKGAGVTEFEFKSADGFFEGDYKVEILFDGQPVAERDFRVQRP